MLNRVLVKLFERDLNLLKEEIRKYKNEETLWHVKEGITNCGGNLCLHIIGNLNHFIGAQLGNTGYIRQRELEFSQKNVSVSEMANSIDDTKKIIQSTLSNLSQEDLEAEYPLRPFTDKMTTEFFMVHLVGHLKYHLGQINYHRRLLEGKQ